MLDCVSLDFFWGGCTISEAHYRDFDGAEMFTQLRKRIAGEVPNIGFWLPSGFDCYMRVLYPFVGESTSDLAPWREVAHVRGIGFRPVLTLEEMESAARLDTKFGGWYPNSGPLQHNYLSHVIECLCPSSQRNSLRMLVGFYSHRYNAAELALGGPEVSIMENSQLRVNVLTLLEFRALPDSPDFLCSLDLDWCVLSISDDVGESFICCNGDAGLAGLRTSAWCDGRE